MVIKQKGIPPVEKSVSHLSNIEKEKSLQRENILTRIANIRNLSGVIANKLKNKLSFQGTLEVREPFATVHIGDFSLEISLKNFVISVTISSLLMGFVGIPAIVLLTLIRRYF